MDANSTGTIFGAFIKDLGSILATGLPTVLVVAACLIGLGLLLYFVESWISGRADMSNGFAHKSAPSELGILLGVGNFKSTKELDNDWFQFEANGKTYNRNRKNLITWEVDKKGGLI